MDPQNYPSVDYQNITPPSYEHRLIHGEWNPVGTYNQQIGSGDVVRFNPSSDDWWDPYSAYIEIMVDCESNTKLADDATTPIYNKVLQLDGCAYSLFRQLVIQYKSDELERIQSFDVLMNALKDVSSTLDERYAKDYEGYGGVTASSPSSLATTWSKGPAINDGLQKNLFGYFPQYNNQRYTDLNAQPGNYIAEGIYATTRNHIYNNSQQAFEPVSNLTDVTLNGNTVAQESARNFNDPSANYATSGTYGMLQGYTPTFSSSCFEPILSPTVKQRYIQSGCVTVGNITRYTFQVPLFSGIFGVGMAPHNYKLIPMKYFGNELVFELQFNPDAFFTSFFSKDQSARSYNVRRLILHADLLQIKDPNVLANAEQDFQNTIRIPTTSWFVGPTAPVTGGVVPPTLQVNLGFHSLRTILMMFLPNDYTSNTYCRKQYRLSMNLTSLQCKIGQYYYPPLPIRGNGGNNTGSINNYQFVKELQRCFKKQFCPSSFINPHNFAINCRASDPNASIQLFTGDPQFSYFEENRVVGKALYGLSFDTLNYENKLLPGVDTRRLRPFELNMTCDTTKPFPRTAQLYSFCHYDLILEIGPNGIRAHGRE